MWVDESAEISNGESRKYGVKVNVYAKQVSSENFTDESCFTFDSSTGTITDYDDNCPKDVVIPYTIDGVQVTKMGDKAFLNKKLTSVTFSSNIKEIGESAFYNNKLTEIVFPQNIKVIGRFAFLSNQLRNVTLPNGIETIGLGAFNDNQLPDEQAFFYRRSDDANIDYTKLLSYGGAKRENVVIPDFVETIESLAFNGNHLTSIFIPESVTKIKTEAFRLNDFIIVTIPSNVLEIHDSVFKLNYNLTQIINKTGRSFDWNYIINGTKGTMFVTGFVGDVVITN